MIEGRREPSQDSMFRWPGQRRRSRFYIGRGLTYLVLGLWVFVCLFPVIWLYMQSFKMPEETYQIPPSFIFVPTTHNYEVTFGLVTPTEFETVSAAEAGSVESKLPKYFLNSVIVAVGTVTIGLVLGTLAAYPLARMRMRGKGFILIGILITRLVPPVVLVLPFYAMWRALGLVDTQPGLIIMFLGITLPFNVWMLRGFLVDIPLELEDAAMVDGCSRVGAFLKIVLPLAAPGLAATAIFNVINVWNEFLLAFLLTSENARTLPPAITTFITDKAILWGRLYAAAGVILLPVIAFSFVVQKHIAHGLTGGAVKGG